MSVLLFPAFNSYRRFLIHKICEEYAEKHGFITFSIGQHLSRRTVICKQSQILEAHHISKSSKSATENLNEVTMGLDSCKTDSDKQRLSANLFNTHELASQRVGSYNSILQEDAKEEANELANVVKRPARRERRPDRAVYVPRARRCQPISPQHNAVEIDKNSAIPSPKKLLPGVVDKDLVDVLNSSSYTAKTITMSKQNSTEAINTCDNKNFKNKLNVDAIANTDSITIPNNCKSILDQSDKRMAIENSNFEDKNIEESSILSSLPKLEYDTKEKKSLDDDFREFQKASKEINRSNRRIIKQSFNSNVLEIPDNILASETSNNHSTPVKKEVDIENDDWDHIFDDNGDCIDPKVLEELTANVGKVKIKAPMSDYKAFYVKQSILNEEEFPHVLEVSNFPAEFKTQDLIMLFSPYKESGFDIKWVDDTHALAIFSCSRAAAEALTMGHPFVLLKPLTDASSESKAKARKCSASLQPYKSRPKTCVALARRLVTGALGVRLKTATEERENEKRVLREAKEQKLLAAKQQEEIWDS